MNSIVKIAKKKSYFQKSWLDQEQYKYWLVEAPEDTRAKCKFYKKVFKLSSKTHADSDCHKQEIKNL